jgi:ATP-dependent helicase/nuclease subunit A
VVLKRFLDLTGYRAILRMCPETGRASRNVDKLLADAHRSGMVAVGDFLAHVQMLSDTAAREGEAPPEAGEAVQLMSVHRAKGLEFSLVVIADAAYDSRAHIPPWLLHPEWGLLVRVSRAEGSEKRQGLMHGLARRREEEMQEAEERRLLYVAATRAREKLLISGHARRTKGGISVQGWLKRLLEALGDEALGRCQAPEPGRQVTFSCWEGQVSCSLYAQPAVGEVARTPIRGYVPPAAGRPVEQLPTALAPPFVASSRASAERYVPSRVWRVVPARPRREVPRWPVTDRWVVGRLVHLGLRLWRFDEAGLAAPLEAGARGAGLTDEAEIRSAIQEAIGLLARFRESALFRKLDRARERHHEVPYAYRPGVDPWGRIDLLCCLPDGRWCVVDFKTNRLRSPGALAQATEQYAGQLRRYRQAVRALLGHDPRLLLCFLDYRGRVLVRRIRPAADSSWR